MEQRVAARDANLPRAVGDVRALLEAAEVIGVAYRMERRIDNVAPTVTAISPRDIEREVVINLRELLRYEPGVAIEKSPARFGLGAIGIRGRTGNRVLMTLDGVRRPDAYRVVVILADIPESWELSHDPAAEPVHDGLVHEYRMSEGIADRGPFAVRRIFLDEPLTDADVSSDFSQSTGTTADGSLHVVSLHVRRRIQILQPGNAR